MLTSRHVFYIVSGMIAFFLMVFRKKRYPEVAVWKMAVMMTWVVITGVFSVKLLSFIETRSFGGDAAFGAVLFMPVFMMPMVLLKIPYKRVMNLYAPAQILQFSIVKIDCYMLGCCFGKYLPKLEIQFPSQIADIVTGLGVVAVLLWIERHKPKEHLYPWLMVIYGTVRFMLDWLRYVPKPWKWGLPPTIIWSLISVMIGTAWLLLNRERKPAPKKKR